jgi:hypothetical protein
VGTKAEKFIKPRTKCSQKEEGPEWVSGDSAWSRGICSVEEGIAHQVLGMCLFIGSLV